MRRGDIVMNCIIKGCDERAVVPLGCCVIHAEQIEDFIKVGKYK